MKKKNISIILSFWLGACSFVFGAPKLVCIEPVHDFGNVKNTQTINYSFVIQNAGDKPLLISKVKGCCGASVSAKDKMLHPGMSTEIKVRASLRGKQGELTKKITIESNDPDYPSYECRLTGVAIAELYTDPATVDFGRIEPGKSVEQNINVLSLSNIQFQVSHVVSTSGYFVAEYVPPSGGAAPQIKVRTVENLPAGSSRSRLHIYTDHPDYPVLDVSIYAYVGEDLYVFPKELRLKQENFSSSKRLMRFFFVRSAAKKPFKVLSAEIPGVAVPFKISDMGEKGFRISLMTDKADPSWEGKTLQITIEQDGQQKQIIVPVKIGS
ncbi:MAG: hypothetical protein PWQ29_998 [Verrucomicrobiota bacterium]|jgi:hypothetical protein|nr:hypothetical protein [Verrucomicrobiota bacterium]